VTPRVFLRGENSSARGHGRNGGHKDGETMWLGDSKRRTERLRRVRGIWGVARGVTDPWRGATSSGASVNRAIAHACRGRFMPQGRALGRGGVVKDTRAL